MPRRMWGDYVIDFHLEQRDDRKALDMWFTVYSPDGNYKHYNVNHPPGFPTEYQAMKFASRWGYELIQGREVDERIEPMD